ncbi:hypothetical protein GGF50DRAFT_125738 [Schizophyllum commune]
MTLPPSRSVVAITRPAPIVHDRVLVRPSMCGLSRAVSHRTASHKTIHALLPRLPPRLDRGWEPRACAGAASPRPKPPARQAAAALVPRYSDSHHELARLRPLLARPPAEGCTRALRSLRAPAFGPVALSSVARRRALRSSSSVLGQRRVVMIPLLLRYLPSRLRCTSLLDIFHSLDRDDVI